MPAVEPLPREQIDGELAAELDELARANGYTANSFLIMGRRPEIARQVLALVRVVMRNPDSTLDKPLIWMIANICSRVYGCEYCVGHTLKNGTRHGLSEAKAEALWEYRSSELFGAAERAALDVALAGGQCPADVSEAELEELRRYYSAEQIVEIALIISLFGFHNRWNRIMRTPLEEPVLDFQSRHQDFFAGDGGPAPKERPV